MSTEISLADIDFNDIDQLLTSKEEEEKLKKREDNEKEFDINDYIQEDGIEYSPPTPLKISTMTAISILGTEIDLVIISKYLQINENIRYVEYGNFPKRGKPVKKISKKKQAKKKIFFNQATVVVNILPDKYVNTKIFTNGKVQMTGLKSPDDGEKAIQILIGEIKNTFDPTGGALLTEGALLTGGATDAMPTLKKWAAKHPENLTMTDFYVVLINTDFKTGFKIKRPVLHKLLINDYGLFAKYEPCIYPGVDTKYYWNNEYIKDGVCHCTKKCNGKGYGKGNGDCKKITIASFQSGSVIITGARTMEQVNDAYTFINKIFEKNYSKIRKVLPTFILEEEATKKKYYYVK